MVEIYKIDNSFLKIIAEPSIYFDLNDAFSYYADGYRFHPKYKSKMWDGKIRLFNYKNKTLPFGLLKKFIQYCKVKKFDYELFGFNKETIIDVPTDFFESLNLPFTPRTYQVDYFNHAIKSKRSVILSVTGSGKSLIIYSIVRLMEQNQKKTLLIVPNISLVKQIHGDFKNYLNGNDKYLEKVHLIYSGKEKESNSPIIISTWQSLIRLKPDYFKKFDVVIVDETHHATGKSIQKIMNSCVNAEYRIGLTGTLKSEKVQELLLNAVLGETYQLITTKNLIDDNYLSELKIKCLCLNYSNKYKSMKLKYQDEIDFLVTHQPRNRFIVNLVKSLKGNTLVLFNYVEKHGKPLFDSISSVKDNVFYISGETKADSREQIRTDVNDMNDCVIVASTGVFSTGINLPSLQNIVFAAPTKSKIKVLQSVGRILRKHHSKEISTVYDISDKFNQKSNSSNYTFEHFLKRYEYYNQECFDTKLIDIQLPDPS